MNTGSLLSRQKLTGRLYFATTGQPLVDLGNVELIKAQPKITRASLKSFHHGLARVTHEEPGEVDWRWSVKLSEFAGAALQLLNLAVATPSNYTNSFKIYNGGVGWLPQYSSGTPFFIGVGLTNLIFSQAINGGGTAYAWTQPANYVYNAETGYLTVISNGGANNVYVTYTVIQPQSAFSGSKQILGDDNFLPAGMTAFAGYYNMSLLSPMTCGGATYVEGVDFTLGSSGKLTAINQIGDGVHPVSCHFSCPAMAFYDYTVLSDAFVLGRAQLNLFDQNDESDPLPNTAPREIVLMSSAEIATTAWPSDGDGTKWDSYTVELLSLIPPTVQDRE
jgi:hypothetical protein